MHSCPSSRGPQEAEGSVESEPDLTVTPRFLLAENEATSHVFSLGVRTPAGSAATGGHVMSLTPRYEFWTNPVGTWVARGSTSFSVPLGDAREAAIQAWRRGLEFAGEGAREQQRKTEVEKKLAKHATK